MTEPRNGSADELGPADEAVGERLRTGRAVPRPAFRGALARRIVTLDPGYGPRPERLRTWVWVWMLSGVLLLLAAAILAGGII